MTRAQFLNDLYRRLEGLTREQAEQHLTYYAEMLADRMEEGMSEEQAVESMEDVDTIARRILEEEGSQPTVQASRPPEPPACPDASRIPGGGGRSAYQGEKKRNWRRPASILLWSLAILCAVISLSLRMTRSGDWREPASSEPATPQAVEESVDVGQSGDPVNVERSGEFSWTGVSSVDVRWTTGKVEVAAWDGDSVIVNTDDSSVLGVEWGQGGDTLHLSSRSSGDTLYLQIPSSGLTELQIHTSSADVDIMADSVSLDTLNVATTSGDVSTGWLHADLLKIKTVSGDIFLDCPAADRVEISTSSGDVDGSAAARYFLADSISGRVEMDIMGEDTEKISVATTSGSVDLFLVSWSDLSLRSSSGDIGLELPEDMGFSMTYDTVSGDARLYMACSQSGKVYTCGDGSCRIDVTTTSGDLRVENW